MTTRKTYVEFLLPGTFMPEMITREVVDRQVETLDIPKNAYAFSFYDVLSTEAEGELLESGELNKSGRYYVGARVLTLKEVEREYPNERILIDNIRFNHWDEIILCRTGNFQPPQDGDVFI